MLEPRATKARRAGAMPAQASRVRRAWALVRTSWTRTMRAPARAAAHTTPAVAASRALAGFAPETAPTKRLREGAHRKG